MNDIILLRERGAFVVCCVFEEVVIVALFVHLHDMFCQKIIKRAVLIKNS